MLSHCGGYYYKTRRGIVLAFYYLLVLNANGRDYPKTDKILTRKHLYTYRQLVVVVVVVEKENNDAALTSPPNAAGNGSTWPSSLQAPNEIVIGPNFTFEWWRRRFAGHTKMDKP